MRDFAARTAFMLVISHLCLWAQTGSSSITGVIRDMSDAPIPGATVRIINAESGVASDVTTNDTGAYRVNSIIAGTYRIEASAPAFQSLVQRVAVSTGQILAVDLILKVGEQQQTITIEA